MTKRLCYKFTQDKDYIEVKFKGDETYKICVGMKILCQVNFKEEEMFNVQQFVIEEITDDFVLINNHELTFHVFKESFLPAFCITTHKFQSVDINEHYNIYDINRMNLPLLYTAISRTRDYKFVHINKNEINDKYVKPFNKLELVNSHFISLYKDGKIYEIVFPENDLHYIGQTCKSLEKRYIQHSQNKDCIVYKTYKKTKEQPEIKLIYNAPCRTKKELEEIEYRNIQKCIEQYG